MSARILTIALGSVNAYLVRDEGALLVDTGGPKNGDEIFKKIEAVGLRPDQVKLIVITHGHWDHVGSAAEVRDRTGADIAMHAREKDWLEKAEKHMPPGLTGWGRVINRIGTMLLPLVNFPPAPVGTVIEDEGLTLDGWGVAGRIVHMPGHSPGSVGVLLEDGRAIVGDAAMSAFPMVLRPGLPVLGYDRELLKQSWRRLLDMGAKKVYPGHGKPFDAEIMRAIVS
ncbi:MAG: MBL fold metallo-hydrolase [Proteobacteria bacterium]|nr:MBL fold metallo-hydrolase [Pseudomonadota bacterium]